jgi:ParB-like chromosome segregation protein Spo0J
MNIESKEIKIISIENIVPNPKNPNTHKKEQIERLAKIYKYQGFRVPLIVSNLTGFLASGHCRLEAAKLAGYKEIPVIHQNFINEAQEYAFMTADNEIARWAKYDKIKAYEDLKSLDVGDFELLGFEKNPYDLKKLNNDISDFKQEVLVIVTCLDEKEQSSLFSEFQERGLNCKII